MRTMRSTVRRACWAGVLLAMAGTLALRTSGMEDKAAGPAGDDVVQITRLIKPEFPAVALAEGSGAGEAHVVFEVDEFGQLDDVLVKAYTRKEFAEATVSAIRQWRFLPARRNGRPVRTVMTVEYVFGIHGMIAIDRKGPGADSRLGKFPGSDFEFKPCGQEDLDGRLQPVERRAPSFPPQLRQEGKIGQVTVEFYIDGEGRTRMPHAVSAAHPVLAAAAEQAVSQWRFEPPRRRGQPALVQAVQIFEFAPLAQQ